MLKYLAIIAVFLSGYSANSLVSHGSHIVVGFAIPSRRGDTMRGVVESFPYNAIAAAVFLISIAFLFWFYKRTKRAELDAEAKRKKELTDTISQAVAEGIKKAVDEIRQERNERKTNGDATKNE